MKSFVAFFLTTFLVITIIIYFAYQVNWSSLALAEYQATNYSGEQNLTYRDLPEVSGTVYFIGRPSLDLPAEDKAIVADLERLVIDLYQNKVKVRSFPIVSIGKTGLPWETPSGRFNILAKKTNHRSSITGVWMPYSLQFLGNYFIHGWPYYDDLTPVPLGYSGGCIRLETADAKEVFYFADSGTPLIVTSKNFASSTSVHYLARTKNLFPQVTAESYLVADLDSGATIVKKNSQELYPVASLTKLLTALVFLDQVNPIVKVTVSEDNKFIPYREVGGLKAGEVFVAKDLLWPLLLESSNKSADVLAQALGEKRFVVEMNKRAKTIGLDHSTFEDPSGISAGNISTTEDLFRLTKHIFFEKNYIFEVSRQKEMKLANHTWQNVNTFVSRSGFLGGKTGQTEAARQTSLNLFELEIPLEDSSLSLSRRIAIIVLRSDDRDADTEKILDYLADNIYLVKNGE
jgi:D-alanyl-D-alanine carboxypeptidase